MRVLYIDLDNVLADFHLVASQTLGVTVNTGYRISPDDWKRLNPRVYRDLPLTAHGRELFELCKTVATTKGLHLAILTAIPRPYTLPYATMDKIKWVETHFPGTDVFIGPYTRDKVYHCKPGDVLVDDNELTIREWNASKGVGIHYTGLTTDVISKINSI